MCGNAIVEKFIRNTKRQFHPSNDGSPECQPECQSWGFDIDHVVYSDPVFHNEGRLREKFQLSPNMSIFSTELSLELRIGVSIM